MDKTRGCRAAAAAPGCCLQSASFACVFSLSCDAGVLQLSALFRPLVPVCVCVCETRQRVHFNLLFIAQNRLCLCDEAMPALKGAIADFSFLLWFLLWSMTGRPVQ